MERGAKTIGGCGGGWGCRGKMRGVEVWRRPGDVRLSAILLLCWMPALCSAFSWPHLPTGRPCSATSTCGSWPVTRRAAGATRTTARRRTAMSSSDQPSSDAGGIEVDSNMDMGEVLESLRREAASSKRNTLQLLSDRLAPRRDDVKDWYTVNWVGNVDRHQSQLFWKLMTMLFNRLTLPFYLMRTAHDLIQRARAAAILAAKEAVSNGIWLAGQTQTTLIPTLKRLALESASELRAYAQLALSRLPSYALSFARALAVASRSASTWGDLLLGRGASFAAYVRNRGKEGGLGSLIGRGARFSALIRNRGEKMRGGVGDHAGVFDSREERREERRGRRRSGGARRRSKGRAGAAVKGIKGPRIAMVAQYSRSKEATIEADGGHNRRAGRGGGVEGWGSKGGGAERERYKGMLVDLVQSIDVLLL